MKHFEYSLKGMDSFKLYGRGWESTGMPEGVICLVHGLGEHSGRYAHVAEKFISAGFNVMSFDLRGHGQTPGKRGATPLFDILMGDIAALLEEAARRYPGVPRLLYGHSMGGFLVLNYGLMCQPKIAGMIATSPGLATVQPVTGPRFLAAKYLSRLLPTLTLNNGLDRSGLSRDEKVITAYTDDPLVHDQISTRLGWDILTRGQWIIENGGKLTIPLLLMIGTRDRVVSVDAVRRFEAAALNDSPTLMTIKYWDDFYHELHNEPEKDQVIQTMIDWATLRMKDHHSDY